MMNNFNYLSKTQFKILFDSDYVTKDDCVFKLEKIFSLNFKRKLSLKEQVHILRYSKKLKNNEVIYEYNFKKVKKFITTRINFHLKNQFSWKLDECFLKQYCKELDEKMDENLNLGEIQLNSFYTHVNKPMYINYRYDDFCDLY